MFALPTVIAAFAPVWVAVISGALTFATSVFVIKTTKKKVNV
jgi:hypothetical protein